jgi:hypothetical protein
MSNIMMFPTATLSGWPFAPKQTPGAKTSYDSLLIAISDALGLAVPIAIGPLAAL